MVNCTVCNAANPDGARFCNNCGSPLEAPRAVEGERKFATVLFADIARSTALAERLDPEDWASIINGAFGFMNAAVARYEGTVGRLMGDAVLAFFGAPLAHEDHAERAVRAGLEIRDAALSYADRLRREYDIEFGLRVGINTGTVVLGLLGDEIKAEYTAIGDTANVAARLQSAARPGMVLISSDTHRLVRHAFSVRPHGWVELKGKGAPVETFEVVAPLAAPAPARGIEGLRSPLVGRDAEFGRLMAHVGRVRAGAGAVVAVVGEAGLGKSRLIAEVREQALAGSPPLRWLECRSVSYGQTLPFHPWKQLGAALLGAAELDSDERLRGALYAAAERLQTPAADVPLLETLLGVRADPLGAVGRRNEDIAQPLAESVMRFLRASTRAAATALPHVLVFDDLHWADTASVDLLAQVATLASTEPLLLLCVMRADRHAPAWLLLDRLRATLDDGYDAIDLDPLDRRHAAELFGNLLHVQNLPVNVRTLILERTDGNPFFLEEVIRSLIDAEHIVHEDGVWRAASSIENVTIPDTLAGVLAARIDRLPESTKRVAQTAAVLGRVFLQRALATVCSAAPPPERIDNVEPHLGTLTYEELVRPRTSAPEREYIFKHALTQEAAYGLLLRRRRRELHARAGRVLEQIYAERGDEMAAVLAHHFHEAGDGARAATYSVRAGRRAAGLYALREAHEHFERALRAFDRSGAPDADELIDLTIDWTVVRYKLKRYDGVLDRLLTAEVRARETNDATRLARVLSWIGTLHMLTGFPTRAGPYLVESDALARAHGDKELMLLPFFFATEALIDRDPAAAILQMAEVLKLAREYRMPEIEGHALASTAIAYARTGDYGRADEYIAAALAAAPSGGHKVKEADVHLLVGGALLEMGRIDEALEHTRHGTRLASAENALECACAGSYATGLGELEAQRTDHAVREFSTSLDLATRADWRGWEGFINRVQAGLAIAELERGSDSAVTDLEAARANAARDHDDYGFAMLSEQLARVYLKRGEHERVNTLVQDALQFYERAGMRPYAARVLDLAARLHAERGDDAAAEQHRQRAALFRTACSPTGAPAQDVATPAQDVATPAQAQPLDQGRNHG